MGRDNSLKSIERLSESSVAHINEQLQKIEWNKKWQIEYPKTERAKLEMDVLKKSDIKEALKEVFSEQSLVLSKLDEGF